MTKLSLLTNIKSKLISQTWTGSSTVVFPTGSVLITKSPELQQALSTLRVPMALIMPGPSQSDPEYHEEPDLTVFEVVIRLVTVIPGDHMGENPIIGANKTGGSTSSEGRGLFEVEQEMFNAIGKLNDLESIQIQNRETGDVGASVYQGSSGAILYIAYCDYTFEAVGTLV